jgi:hypothetical protein
MAARRSRRIDLWLGIVLGLVLGVAIVAVFVFVFSEETVDAPRLEQNQTPAERPADR